MKIRNTFAIFLISGFWHGANWTFIIWGALNAIYFLPLLLTNNNRKNIGDIADGKIFPSFRELFSILNTFMLTAFAWIFFRAENVSHAINYISKIFSMSLFNSPIKDLWRVNTDTLIIYLLVCLVVFFSVEWLNRNSKHSLDLKNIKYKTIRVFIYYLLLIAIFFMNSSQQEFIYFQF